MFNSFEVQNKCAGFKINLTSSLAVFSGIGGLDAPKMMQVNNTGGDIWTVAGA